MDDSGSDNSHDYANALTIEGGRIPDMHPAPAFAISMRRPSSIPVLIAVPHAGRIYPPLLARQMRDPNEASLRLEDRLIDQVAVKVAEQTSASLLIANAPRAMIDLNRSYEDVDWSMIEDAHEERSMQRSQSRRVRSGLGLIPRRLPGLGEIWRSPLPKSQLEERIACVHNPYHEALGLELMRLRERWGAALLLDLHSMPPIQQDGAPKFVLGDRFGASCSASLSAIIMQNEALSGRGIAHNRPYAGGYVLDRHATPRKAIHAIQLEVCRSTYLDSAFTELGEGADSIVEELSGLVQHLAGEVAAMGSAEASRLAAE